MSALSPRQWGEGGRRPGEGRSWPAATIVLLLLVFALPAFSQEPTERLEVVRHSLSGTHCRYRTLIGGIETDDYVTRPCSSAAGLTAEMRTPPRLRNVAGRIVRREVVGERPLERYVRDVDIETGEVVRHVPFFFHSKPALVFDPNPVASLDAPGLQDGNDAAGAVPPAAYHAVELTRAAESGPLRGPHAAIADLEAPNVAPVDASGPLTFDREASGFEDVNAFFHIDRNQEHVRSLGFDGERAIAPYPVEVDTHSLSGQDNSVFAPSLTQPGRGELHFGEGGTDDAEDADLVVHEYAHVLLEWIAPGTFGGAYGSQPRALAEGIADYWAWSAHRMTRLSSGRDLYCLADWDARCWMDDASQQCRYPAGSDCLRRLDSTRTMADYLHRDNPGTEHLNGSIWSSALREIQEAVSAAAGLTEGRRIVDALVLESVFGVPPRPTFAIAAERLLQADRLLFGGGHAGVICAAMTARGIIATCSTTPRGELTFFQAPEAGLAIPDANLDGVTSELTISDARAIEDIAVQVDIEHPIRGDLRVELIAPGGATFVLQQVSLDRGADIRATFGRDAEPLQSLAPLIGRSAAGVWRLRVVDLRARDLGTLRSWGLLLRLAGDEPLVARPRGEPAQMIPVAAHVRGALETTFRTDMRLANPSASPRTAMLVFTPSGADGTTTFSAMQVVLAAGQTLALDDVVRTLFQTTGSGSLEILGDVVAMSRIHHTVAAGTLGQQVPPVADTTALGENHLYVNGLREDGLRYNLGITETAGASARVRVLVIDEVVEIDVAPFSHVQFPARWPDAVIQVVAGNGRVAGYVSEVAANGDAMFVPAERLRHRLGIAPAASLIGLDGTRWRSDFWSAVPVIAFPFIVDIYYRTGEDVVWLQSLEEIQIDIVGTSFARPGTAGALVGSLPAEFVAHTRVAGEGTSQYVPFLDPDGPPLQHLVFIENDARFRTNIGIVASADAIAEVSVFDAAGGLLEQRVVSVFAHAAQNPVMVAVTGGRAEVRFLAGTGRAWASLIDRGTRDATLVVAR